MTRPARLWQCGAVATETDPPDTGSPDARRPNEPVHVFPFDFSDPVGGIASRVFGAWPFSAGVAVSAHGLWIRYGPWTMKTSIDNVRSAQLTGPFHWWRVLGPARLGLGDGSVTFATTTRRGVCLRFKEPVPGGLPSESVRHDEVTVTVKDPEGLVSILDTLHRPG
jgi:hypothetical protein